MVPVLSAAIRLICTEEAGEARSDGKLQGLRVDEEMRMNAGG
jgi:hypothetical protein